MSIQMSWGSIYRQTTPKCDTKHVPHDVVVTKDLDRHSLRMKQIIYDDEVPDEDQNQKDTFHDHLAERWYTSPQPNHSVV